MKDHYTSPHLHTNLADIVTRVCYLEQSHGIYVPKKKDKIFKDLPNVFGITDDILALGHDREDKDHDDTLQKVLQICRQVNLKLNKDKCHFRYMQVHSLAKVYPEIVSNLIHENSKQ